MKKRTYRKPLPEQSRFKGEMVPEKDNIDMKPTGRYMANNPYKTPPNNEQG